MTKIYWACLKQAWLPDLSQGRKQAMEETNLHIPTLKGVCGVENENGNEKSSNAEDEIVMSPDFLMSP